MAPSPQRADQQTGRRSNPLVVRLEVHVEEDLAPLPAHHNRDACPVCGPPSHCPPPCWCPAHNSPHSASWAPQSRRPRLYLSMVCAKPPHQPWCWETARVLVLEVPERLGCPPHMVPWMLQPMHSRILCHLDLLHDLLVPWCPGSTRSYPGTQSFFSSDLFP